jgi:hypothetical protein
MSREIVERCISYVNSVMGNLKKMEDTLHELNGAYFTPKNGVQQLLESYKTKEEEVKFDLTFAEVVKEQPFFIKIKKSSDGLIGMVKAYPEMFMGTWIYKEDPEKKCHYFCNGPKIERAALNYPFKSALVRQIRDEFKELYNRDEFKALYNIKE